MAPLCEAVKTTYKCTDDGYEVYEGEVDPLWTVAAIPQGGYALGLIVDAALQAQARTLHPDVCHCTAHFYRSALCKAYTVRIRRERVGKGFTNLIGELVQDDTVRITAHMVFTTLPSAPSPQLPTPTSQTLTQPSPYARLIPLKTHPSRAIARKMIRKFTFRDSIAWSGNEKDTRKRNKGKAKSGEGGLEWSAWAQVTENGDAITTSTLPFWGDMFVNLPELLPREQRPGPSWYPTMVYTVDFKVKIDKAHAQRTVGLWHQGTYMQDGRHDATVEVWTAPSEFGESKAKVDKDWRKQQHCLCVARQMALVLPISANEKRRASKL